MTHRAKALEWGVEQEVPALIAKRVTRDTEACPASASKWSSRVPCVGRADDHRQSLGEGVRLWKGLTIRVLARPNGPTCAPWLTERAA